MATNTEWLGQSVKTNDHDEEALGFRGPILSASQQKALSSNFEKRGPFYLSVDIHPMLDCANIPETDEYVASNQPGKGAAELISSDSRISIARNGSLRGEFFGGIFFDQDNHEVIHFDQRAYYLMSSLLAQPRSVGEIIASCSPDLADWEDTIDGMLLRGLVVEGDQRFNVEHFPLREATLSYLQSPLVVEAELTYGCFRECRHCAYHSSPRAATADELTAAQWSAIFSKLSNAGVAVIQLTGGDPFFRKDIFDLLEAADEAGLSIYLRSDTVALKPGNIDRVASLKNLWHVGTSIDGASKEQHDWMRGPGAYEILEKRVRQLSESGIDVSAGATLHKGNFHDVVAMGRQVADWGARWFDVGFLSPVGRAKDLQDYILSGEEISAALEMYLSGASAGEYVPLHSHYRRRIGSTNPFNDARNLLPNLPYLTEWPWSRLRIDPAGRTYTAGKLKGSDYSSGFNLIESDLAYVWDHSPNLRELRKWADGDRLHSLDYRVLSGRTLDEFGSA